MRSSDGEASPPSNPPSSPTTKLSFGLFKFDPATGELWREGHAVRLAPKPAQLLGLLLTEAGELVPRREIEVKVWGNVPIDLDRSVNFAIRQIRSALGDSADGPRYIETLPKRGYRFIAPVKADGAATPEIAPLRDGPGGSWWKGRFTPLAAAAAVAILLLATVRAQADSGSWPFESVPSRPMLAVLPLTQLGDDETHAYFVSGLTDELITRLARLDPEHLGVIARTSAGRAASTVDSDVAIGEDLSANYLLRGSVTAAGEVVRVNVRLVDAADGSVLWADRYVEPIPTSPELELEVATRVADALRSALVPDLAPFDIPTDTRTTSSETREAYLRGSYLLKQGWDRRDDAVTFLRDAVASDSTYAPAHTALGGALLSQNEVEEGRFELTRARALDPSLAEPHVQLGVDALYNQWDAESAAAHFQRALELEPGNVLSHHPYAYYLSIAGSHRAAISEIEAALRLDPVSPLVNGDVGRIYYRAGRFDEALGHCRRTLELVTDHPTALSCLINIHMLRGDPEGALPFALASMGADTLNEAVSDRMRSAAPSDAMNEYFAHRLEAMRALVAQGAFAHVPLAQAALFLGLNDVALDALEMALERRSPILPQVPGDPCFAVLSGDPRFEAIILAMGIP